MRANTPLLGRRFLRDFLQNQSPDQSSSYAVSIDFVFARIGTAINAGVLPE